MEREKGQGRWWRRQLQMRELCSLGFFAFATCLMMADYVATEAGPLRDLPGGGPWYVAGLPWIGPVFVLVSWLALRRWLGAWVPFLAYMVFVMGSMPLVRHVARERIETIELAGPLGFDEQEDLEKMIGERVFCRTMSDHPQQLMIRRDPQVHERAVRWLGEHGR